MPKVTTLSIVQALPFEKLAEIDDIHGKIPYKKLIIENWDTVFKLDYKLEMEDIIWTANAEIVNAGYELSDAPLDILAGTAKKLRPYLYIYFSNEELYPISQETHDMIFGSQQETKTKKKHWWEK